MKAYRLEATLLLALTLAACTGGGDSAPKSEPAATQPTASAATGTDLTPDPGGKVITVEMSTDEKGSYFSPAEINASKGDVIRYTLKVGVHNVHFLPDSNAGKSGYPSAPSEFLQLPGQTYDVKVQMVPGSYSYQCDPHAALGMKGHVIVK
jgi:plastocyanin